MNIEKYINKEEMDKVKRKDSSLRLLMVYKVFVITCIIVQKEDYENLLLSLLDV